MREDQDLITLVDRWLTLNKQHAAMVEKEAEDVKLSWATNTPADRFYNKNLYPLVRRIMKAQPTTVTGISAKAKFISIAFDGSDLEDVRPFFRQLARLGEGARLGNKAAA